MLSFESRSEFKGRGMPFLKYQECSSKGEVECSSGTPEAVAFNEFYASYLKGKGQDAPAQGISGEVPETANSEADVQENDAIVPEQEQETIPAPATTNEAGANDLLENNASEVPSSVASVQENDVVVPQQEQEKTPVSLATTNKLWTNEYFEDNALEIQSSTVQENGVIIPQQVTAPVSPATNEALETQFYDSQFYEDDAPEIQEMGRGDGGSDARHLAAKRRKIVSVGAGGSDNAAFLYPEDRQTIPPLNAGGPETEQQNALIVDTDAETIVQYGTGHTFPDVPNMDIGQMLLTQHSGDIPSLRYDQRFSSTSPSADRMQHQALSSTPEDNIQSEQSYAPIPQFVATPSGKVCR